ncbi:MAG: hypothetical protein ACI4KI_01405 [Candidatus Fimenecus sp.]
MFDLVVFCVGQEKHIKDIPKNSNIYITNEERYYEYWKFLTCEKGCWYNLYAHKDEVAGTNICQHLDREPLMQIPGFVVQDDTRFEGLTPYMISEEYQKSFEAIITHLLLQSPNKKIYVLARYQSSEAEVVMGTYKVNTFLDLMRKKSVYANVCYIITQNDNAL